jgi:hypothetical protein
MFSVIRVGRTDLGIAHSPCWTCQRRTSCAGVVAPEIVLDLRRVSSDARQSVLFHVDGHG